MEELTKTLTDLGLEQTEIKVYLSSLKIGKSAASIVAKQAGVPRSTACYTLENLVKKGLVTKVLRGNTHIYTPEDPGKLRYLVDMEKKKLTTAGEKLDRMMGLLMEMRNPEIVMPKVRFYEGEDEIKTLYNKVLDAGFDIDSIEEKGELYGFFPEYTKSWIKRRVKKNINNRCIFPMSKVSGTITNFSEPKLLRTTKGVSAKKYPFSCDIKIFGDNVVIVSFSDLTPTGIWIKNEDIANHFQSMFNLLWDNI